MDEGVCAKENHGDNLRPAAKQRPSRKPLGEIQANNLVAHDSIAEDGKQITAKHDASETSAPEEQPHEDSVDEPAGTATAESVQDREAAVHQDVELTVRSETENEPGTSELNVSTSLSAREYESALEDEIIARLNTLEEMYTSHFRSEQRSMRQKYLEEESLGAPRQLHLESAVTVPLLSLTLLQAKLAEWKDRYKPAPPLGEQRPLQQQGQQRRNEQATSC